VSLRYHYLRLIEQGNAFPLLYTLRVDNTLKELTDIVVAMQRGKKVSSSKFAVVLLIDGYDEISYSQRVSLSSILRDFDVLERGFFILSSRTFYEIIDLPVRRRYLQPFTNEDALAFVRVFLRHQRSAMDPAVLLGEMKRRGFEDFFTSPLLLAMSTILQRGQRPSVPRNALRLLSQVVSFLTFKWDKERGIERQSLEGVEGHDLHACLKRVAAAFTVQEGSDVIAEAAVSRHLSASRLNTYGQVRS
jgi:hypothetical protein